jgi:alkylated DNA repair protein (DNA oxidative demethylase)
VITAASTVVGRLEPEIQRLLVAELGRIRRDAELFLPVAGSLDMSVLITNAGPVGWCATNDDRQRFPHARRSGYHYSDIHPVTGKPWPRIPALVLELAERFRDPNGSHLPFDCAHIVVYKPGADLGRHRDKTEARLDGEVITLCLGDPAVFDVWDHEDVMTSVTLMSGDVVRLSGPTRNLEHRIRRVLPGDTADMFNASPLPKPGRVVISVRSGAARAA